MTITETLEKVVEVEAASAECAEKMVAGAWFDGEYILDADCFAGANFKADEGREIENEEDN